MDQSSRADPELIDHATPKANGLSGALPRLLCAVGADSPALVALEGRLDAVSSRRRFAILGALRDPVEMIEEIRRLVAPGDAPAPSGPGSP